MSEPVPLRHRLEYLLFRSVRGLVSLVPLPVALGLGDVLGWLAGAVLRIRRGAVDENLERAFPDATSGWRRRTAVASYRHLGREAVVTFRLSGVTPERIRAMTEIDGFDAFRADVEAGGGVVLVSGHLGNWEMGSACLAARGIPIDAVMHRQRNRRFDEDLRETRGRLGMGIILRDVAPRRVLRSLAQGRVVGLVADQNVAGAGIFVDFFGVPASTARGPAVFALRTGSPVWVGVAVRNPEAGPRYLGFVRKVEVELGDDTEENVRRITEATTRELESFIRAYPEQYFWQHRRWKTRPATGGSPAGTA
jgi:KDO2-lipid IV(A) lauroyltransferase